MSNQQVNSEQGGQGGQGGAPGGTTPPAAWFPEVHKGYVEAKGWKGPADALESYINLEKLVGADRAGRTVVLPKDEKDEEGQKAFRTKLGVPETPEAYELPLGGGEDQETSKAFAAAAAKWFHAAGVPKAAAQTFAAQWNAFAKEQFTAEQARLDASATEALSTLQAEWGDKFNERSEFARRFLKASGWDDAKLAKYEQVFGTAEMLKDFWKWGSATGEHSFADGQGSGGGFSMNVAQAREKLETIRRQRSDGTIGDREWSEVKAGEAEKLAAYIASKA